MREPIEPTEVYDSTRRSTGERLRSAAGRVVSEGTRVTSRFTDAARTRADSVRTAAGEFADEPTAKVRDYQERAREQGARISQSARERAGRAAAAGGPVDWTETKINSLLGGIGHRLNDAVRAGQVDRAVQFVQGGVSKGAGQARRLLRR